MVTKLTLQMHGHCHTAGIPPNPPKVTLLYLEKTPSTWSRDNNLLQEEPYPTAYRGSRSLPPPQLPLPLHRLTLPPPQPPMTQLYQARSKLPLSRLQNSRNHPTTHQPTTAPACHHSRGPDTAPVPTPLKALEVLPLRCAGRRLRWSQRGDHRWRLQRRVGRQCREVGDSTTCGKRHGQESKRNNEDWIGSHPRRD